ncbi:MAG TPA: secretin N-terminal domain-containing protein [Opitutaceae bacterium]|nr:secretin N-terminal domain-containing protein [Opitutaceae bacterium]
MRTLQLPSLAVAALLAASAVRGFAQAPAAENPPAPAAPAPEAPAPAAAPLADKPAAVEAPAASAPVAAPAAAPSKGKDAAGRDTLSVDFPDEDVRNILRNVADLFELNIIMPESLQGKTTIKLRDVTWRQIFQNVLDPVGYTYVEDGNIIKIVSKDTLNDEPVTTEVFLINYARAADILPTITSLVDPAKGKIVVDGRSNSLVITERPTRMSRIRPIIEQLDRATDQVMIETKFVEVNNSDIKNIGVNWSSLGGYQLGAGNLAESLTRNRGQNGSDGSTTNNTNTVNNTNGTTNQNQQTNTSNNSNTITSTNGVPVATSTTGTTGTLTSTGGVNATATNTVNDTLTLLNSLTNTADTTRQITALFTASQFNIVLSALQTLNDVKIVSNPTIVTLNNTEASINIGESDPLPNYTFNPQTGTQEVSGFSYKDIGIILKVTPQVNSRGFIKLTLAPEVSQKNGTLSFGAAQLPIIATRKATTTVSLKDGYTMGIGGLISTSVTKGGNKVPLLGSVPIVGRLFRSDTTNTGVTNLIIFITAKTLSAEGAPVEQVFESGRVRQLELRREDLPGYRDGSSPYIADPTSPAGKTSSRLATPGAK